MENRRNHIVLKTWKTATIKSWTTTTVFFIKLRAISAFVDAQSRNICCVLAAVRPIICAECKLYTLSTELDKCGVFHMYWIWLDAEKNVDFVSYTFVDNRSSHVTFSAWMKWVTVVRERNVTLKQWQVLPKPMLLMELISDRFCQSPCCLWNLNTSLLVWKAEHFVLLIGTLLFET